MVLLLYKDGSLIALKNVDTLKWSPTVGQSIKDHKCISVVLDFSLYDLAE